MKILTFLLLLIPNISLADIYVVGCDSTIRTVLPSITATGGLAPPGSASTVGTPNLPPTYANRQTISIINQGSGDIFICQGPTITTALANSGAGIGQSSGAACSTTTGVRLQANMSFTDNFGRGQIYCISGSLNPLGVVAK